MLTKGFDYLVTKLKNKGIKFTRTEFKYLFNDLFNLDNTTFYKKGSCEDKIALISNELALIESKYRVITGTFSPLPFFIDWEFYREDNNGFCRIIVVPEGMSIEYALFKLMFNIGEIEQHT